MISDKVRPHHLERKAILYVRQSIKYCTIARVARCNMPCGTVSRARSPSTFRLDRIGRMRKPVRLDMAIGSVLAQSPLGYVSFDPSRTRDTLYTASA